MRSLSICLILCFLPCVVFSQIERKKTVSDHTIEDMFMSEYIVGLSTVHMLPKQNLSTTVRHNFGYVSGGIDDFYGLDVGATVRLGINYGLTDKINLGLGRSSLENNVDVSLKYRVISQMESGSVPLHITIKAGMGVNTQKERRFDFTLIERLNYIGSIMIARKFNDSFSLQVSPMVSHFNTVATENSNRSYEHTLVGLGLAARYKWSRSNALAIEYLPVIGSRNPETTNHLALTYEIDTGGHVFQIFLMSGQAFTEQHLMARTTSDISERQFRLGFNINRLFSL